MVKKIGKYPANARVDVDYSKGKPKIKFSYPKIKGKSAKKQAEQQGVSMIHSFIFIVLLLSPLLFLYVMPQKYLQKPTTCRFYEIDDYETLRFECDNGNYSVYWQYFGTITEPQGYRYSYLTDGYSLIKKISLSFLVYIIYAVILLYLNKLLKKYLIKQKWYQKWLPKVNAEGLIFKSAKKYKKFYPKDIEGRIAIIPYFNNIVLDYKTEGDFSKQLKKIKIRENRYHKYKKGKVGKEKVKEFNWYAIFYFKEKPKDGYLEVIYK